MFEENCWLVYLFCNINPLTIVIDIRKFINYLFVIIILFYEAYNPSLTCLTRLSLPHCLLSWKARLALCKWRTYMDGKANSHQNTWAWQTLWNWGRFSQNETSSCLWKHVSNGLCSWSTSLIRTQSIYWRTMGLHIKASVRCLTQKDTSFS